jgi:hypothetical protein
MQHSSTLCQQPRPLFPCSSPCTAATVHVSLAADLDGVITPRHRCTILPQYAQQGSASGRVGKPASQGGRAATLCFAIPDRAIPGHTVASTPAPACAAKGCIFFLSHFPLRSLTDLTPRRSNNPLHRTTSLRNQLPRQFRRRSYHNPLHPR